MVKPPQRLLESLDRYDRPVQLLALGLRQLVLRELTPSHEHVFSMRSKVVLLYGSSERVVADCVCSIAMFRLHVTLMFHHGSDLTDDYGLLRGAGKAMRHIRVEQLDDLDRPELKAYLRQARTRSDLSRRGRTESVRMVTRFKSAAPTKRREFPRLY